MPGAKPWTAVAGYSNFVLTAEEARITVLVDDFQIADSNPCGQDRQFGLLKRMAIEGDRLGFSSLLDFSTISRQRAATYCSTVQNIPKLLFLVVLARNTIGSVPI